MRPKGLRNLDLQLFALEDSLDYKITETTYRQDGCTIGRDYLRVDGSTFCRGELSQKSLQVDRSDILGRGAFSTVCRAIWQRNDHEHIPVAVKECAIVNKSTNRRKMLLKELRILSRESRQRVVSHVSIIQLYGAFLDADRVVMVMELMDRGSLQDLIDTCVLEESTIASITYQVVAGLEYLHQKNSQHRDLKPANILINSVGQVKLCDLGMSSFTDSDQSLCTTVLGTSKYMAPERLRSLPYGRSSDIWSLGLVILGCITRESPWKDATSMVELLMTIEETNMNDEIPSRASNEIQEMISLCLQVDPAMRIPARVMKHSPFFESNEVHSIDHAIGKFHLYLCDQRS